MVALPETGSGHRTIAARPAAEPSPTRLLDAHLFENDLLTALGLENVIKAAGRIAVGGEAKGARHANEIDRLAAVCSLDRLRECFQAELRRARGRHIADLIPDRAGF